MVLRFSPLLPIALLAALVACEDNDPDIDLVDPTKLLVREVSPADSVEVAASEHISITFNRAAEADEFVAQIFPPPASTGPFEPPASGRNWTWYDVEWNPNWDVHKLILSGSRLQNPQMFSYFTGSGAPAGRIQSILHFPKDLKPETRSLLLYALDTNNDWDWVHPANLDEQLPYSVQFYDLPDTDVVTVSIGHLLKYEEFLAVAVLDSDGDGWFDPATDWWGYPELSAQSSDPLYAEAHTAPDTIAIFRTIIQMRAPAPNE